mmetsp:Transcript_18916/g.62170  ORF Transcript_18916/g.62170 Transcript_18916/m.62170 type:complete len:316 (+) Transcript_18916:55-1002(+)
MVLSSILLLPLNVLSILVPFVLDVFLASVGCYKNLADKMKTDLDSSIVEADSLISVIVPAYREVDSAVRAIRHARAVADDASNIEFVVAAADDETFDKLVIHYNKNDNNNDNNNNNMSSVSLVKSQCGRSAALNAGARNARGEVLLFLHADCLLPSRWDMEARRSLRKRSTIAGAFSFDVDCEGLDPPTGLEGMKEMARIRSKYLQLPYGDQALFISRCRFWSLRGFPDMPLMEDYALVTSLRRICLHETLRCWNPMRIDILQAKTKCSVRRWRSKGVATVTLVNQIVVIMYFYFWISPPTLYALYYGRRLPDKV